MDSGVYPVAGRLGEGPVKLLNQRVQQLRRALVDVPLLAELHELALLPGDGCLEEMQYVLVVREGQHDLVVLGLHVHVEQLLALVVLALLNVGELWSHLAVVDLVRLAVPVGDLLLRLHVPLPPPRSGRGTRCSWSSSSAPPCSWWSGAWHRNLQCLPARTATCAAAAECP